MSQRDNPLSEGDIAATNVLPAFEASLRYGATEAELEAALGWQRQQLALPDARVSGTSTYQHMELMFAKPDYPHFVTAAARGHDAASLGIVGLACKTLPDVRAAMACHARFQRLTNRTATYETTLEHDGLHLRERRDDPRLGSQLISDYTMLVAVRLLSLLSGTRVPVLAMFSRRREMPADERGVYEGELAAPLHLNAARAELVIAPGFADRPVQKADAELANYFRGVLERALPPTSDDAPLVAAVKAVVRERLRNGQPTLDDTSRAMRIGGRTLQRRLGALGTSYQQVLDDTLAGLAAGYLEQSQLSLAEVAWLLGYTEQSSFFRAFRRWYGATPDAFRQRAAS